ncbi:MAG: hypothetical protein NT015_16315 [Alphaproteobacteria bacterium]|nr:hypothetical protein [Alphaproteobacteria bacterium]
MPAQVGDLMIGGQRAIVRQEYGEDWPAAAPATDDAPASPR